MISKLRTNDLIYICAPAKSIEQEHLDFAKTYFESKGYRVELSKHSGGRYNYFSGSLDERLSDFQEGLDRDNVKAIICARGGYGCVHLLDKLDWTKFKQSPKWICGFSDITNFHLELLKFGFPSIHSTMPLDFQSNSEASLTSLLNCLEVGQGKIMATPSNLNHEGTAEGQIIGGNLSILFASLARHGESLYSGKILFIEDLGEHLYHFDRMFYAFLSSGILDVVSGVVVGGFTDVKDTPHPFGLSIEQIIKSHFSHRNIPIGFNFPIGHQPENEALIFGVPAKLVVGKTESVLEFSSSL